MGLFRQKDELFEIMSRAHQGRGSGGATGARAPTRSPATTSVSAPRPRAAKAFSPISWAYGRREGFGDLIEIDGEPVVIVEDGLTEALAAADDEPARTLSVRADTMVVGGLLSLGLLFTAFFLGRHTGEDPSTAASPEVAVATAAAKPTIRVGGGAAESEADAPATPNTQAASADAAKRSTSVTGGFRPNANTAAKPASVKREAKKGKYTLVVCTTTAKAAKQVATWLNTDSRSPIFGRNNLQAYGTSRGSVRIRGFSTRDKGVLKRVRATYDPLGGSSRFTSAYFLKVR